MTLERITSIQEGILVELAEFQYLTTPQLCRLTGRKRSRTNELINGLFKRHKPLVHSNSYTIDSKTGRKPSIHFLLPRGEKILSEMGSYEGLIKLPRRYSVDFTSDYTHRVLTIETLVSAKLWAKENGYRFSFSQFYFQQKKGSNRDNKGGKSLSANRIDVDTRGIGYIIPDGVFLIEKEGENPLFGLVEQHNGTETKRVLEQIHAHCVAIHEGSPSITLDIQHNGKYIANRVFITFERESCMLATMKRLLQSSDFTPFKNLFYFALSEDIEKKSFSDCWFYVDGAKVDLK